MSQYLLMEQEASDLQRKQKDLLEGARAESRDMTPAERDTFFQYQGAAQALEANARTLRDAELDELRRAPEGPAPIESDAKAEFLAYMKSGKEPRASVTLTDANGGYIVPEPVHGPFVDKVRTNNPFFANATVFNMTGDTIMYLPRKVSHGVVAAAAETGSRSEQTAPTFGTVTLRAFDHYTDQRATQQWVDSVGGGEEMLLGWIYDDLFEAAELLMVNGSGGTTESAGFFANTGTSGYTIKYSSGSGVLNTDLFQCYFALNSKYRGASKWFMNAATLSSLSTKAHPGAADTPLVTMAGDGTPVIFGKPVVEVESAPTSASATYPIAFGDMSAAYAIGVHRNISILRDPYTAAPYVRYYGLARIGGSPWDRQAAILLKGDSQ